MEFGISLPSRGALAKPDLVLKIAEKAEALKYASVFVSDHVVLPASSARSVYPYSPTKLLPGGAVQDYLEPLALLSYLAHATRRIRLGQVSSSFPTGTLWSRAKPSRLSTCFPAGA